MNSVDYGASLRELTPDDYNQLAESSRILEDYRRESMQKTFFDEDKDENYMQN